jgi:60 kDa SS-A/Ro ribonucleoprotein
MNLNTFERHGVLKDQKVVDELARKLADPDEVRRNNAFPYQLLTSFQNVNATIPAKLRNALQDAMETATENVPRFDGGVAVCIDTSGSMQSSATGYRQGATSKTRCVDVAALVGASIARKNDDTTLVPFDTRVHATHTLNVRDSIMTNAQKLANFGGGGTDVASAMRLLNTLVGNRPKTVIFVSDNESWYNEGGNGLYYRGSGLAHEWAAYKKKVPGAKLICIDVVANRTTQVVDSGDVMNIGGFSDKVWPLIERFVKEGNTDFVKLINETVSLESPTVVLEEPISEADGE